MRIEWAAGYCKFPQLPFRRIFCPVKRPVPANAVIVTAYTNGEVTFRSNRRREGYHEATDLSGFQGVKVGDFVVHGLDILRGSIGASDSFGAISSVCAVCIPIMGAEPRFFAYAMRAQASSGFPRAMARGVREGGADFRRWDTLGDLPLPVPPEPEQQVIADFLDVETARIDALIAKKSRLEVAITARVLASIESVIWAPKYSRIPLRRVCRFIDYRGATPSKSNSGVSLITASHIRDGWLDLENEPQWVDESTYKEWMRRGWPAVGDVLLTTEAPLGNVAQITDSRVALAQRVILLKPNESVILADFLPLALRSLTFQNMLSAYATGSTALGIKADRLKALNVPVPPLVVQLAHVNEIMRQESAANRARSALMAQISLLRQRKQALITAAVTGEMDVPGVSA